MLHGTRKQKVLNLKRLGMRYLHSIKQNIQLKQLSYFVVLAVTYQQNLQRKQMHSFVKQMRKARQLQHVKQAKTHYKHLVLYCLNC
ncbi:hypothetical protein D3C76_1279480 [compost metagenome]